MPIDPLTLAGGAALLVLLVGIVLGARGTIVVFADLGDLITTFSLVITAGFISVLAMKIETWPEGRNTLVAATVCAIALAIVTWRSWRDNRSVLATLLAVFTKLPFALGVPLLVLQVATPTGETAAQRAANRGKALLLLTILAPIMLLLVRNRDGLHRYLGVT